MPSVLPEITHCAAIKLLLAKQDLNIESLCIPAIGLLLSYLSRKSGSLRLGCVLIVFKRRGLPGEVGYEQATKSPGSTHDVLGLLERRNLSCLFLMSGGKCRISSQ